MATGVVESTRWVWQSEHKVSGFDVVGSWKTLLLPGKQLSPKYAPSSRPNSQSSRLKIPRFLATLMNAMDAASRTMSQQNSCRAVNNLTDSAELPEARALPFEVFKPGDFLRISFPNDGNHRAVLLHLRFFEERAGQVVGTERKIKIIARSSNQIVSYFLAR